MDDLTLDAIQGAARVLVLVIVGKNDAPIFIGDFSAPGTRSDPPHLTSFVAHAALDVIDDLVWQCSSLYLKQVDVFDCLAVYAHVTCSHTKFLLVTDAPFGSKGQEPPQSESIKTFFKQVHELYCKIVANPLYIPNTSINVPPFKAAVAQAAKALLA